LVLLALDSLGLEGLPYRAEEREVLDPLGAPVGLDLRARNAPHLFALRLEEVPVQAPTEPRRDESLERRLVLRRVNAHPQVRCDATDGFDRPEVAERVHRRDRVVVELAAVVDAAETRTAQEVVGAEDLEPKILDRLHLGEEAVAADVEAPAVA